MAEALPKEPIHKEPETKPELERAIRNELSTAEVVARPNYARAGALLSKLRPLVPKRQWPSYLRSTFDLSIGRATRYIGYATKMRAYEEGRGPKPTRITPHGKHPEDQHHARGYAAFKERIEQAKRQAAAFRQRQQSTEGDRTRALELCHAIIDSGFKHEAHALHPDKGGTNRDMHLLKVARDHLRARVGTIIAIP